MEFAIQSGATGKVERGASPERRMPTMQPANDQAPKYLHVRPLPQLLRAMGHSQLSSY